MKGAQWELRRNDEKGAQWSLSSEQGAVPHRQSPRSSQKGMIPVRKRQHANFDYHEHPFLYY
eukprot:1146268-Pelagomonas_calceolata.AAC.2